MMSVPGTSRMAAGTIAGTRHFDASENSTISTYLHGIVNQSLAAVFSEAFCLVPRHRGFDGLDVGLQDG